MDDKEEEEEEISKKMDGLSLTSPFGKGIQD